MHQEDKDVCREGGRMGWGEVRASKHVLWRHHKRTGARQMNKAQQECLFFFLPGALNLDCNDSAMPTWWNPNSSRPWGLIRHCKVEKGEGNWGFNEWIIEFYTWCSRPVMGVKYGNWILHLPFGLSAMDSWDKDFVVWSVKTTSTILIT